MSFTLLNLAAPIPTFQIAQHVGGSMIQKEIELQTLKVFAVTAHSHKY